MRRRAGSTWLILSVLLWSHAAPAAPTTTRKTADADRTFTNTKYKVRFTVPGKMEYYKPDVKGMLAQYRTKGDDADSAPLELIQLMVVDNGKELRPQDLALVVEGMRKNVEKAGGKVIASEASNLGGIDARDFTYTRDVKGEGLELKQIVAIKNGKAYVLGFVAKEGKLNDFVQRAHMARDSFQWLE